MVDVKTGWSCLLVVLLEKTLSKTPLSGSGSGQYYTITVCLYVISILQQFCEQYFG